MKDREARRPFPAALKLHVRIKREALRRGLICYPSGGTADGISGDHVLLAPPYIIDETHIDEIANVLAEVIP